MGDHATTGLIHDLVAARHANGIIIYVLGFVETCRRVDEVAVRYNHGTHDQPGLYRGFVDSCYREGQHYPQIPDIPNAIAFQAVQDPSPFTHTHMSNSGRQCYILDVEAEDISLVIPLSRYVPYEQDAPGRSSIVLEKIELVPYWVAGAHGLGVPVSGGDVSGVRHGDRHFTNGPDPLGRVKTTVFFKIEWPGYASWDAQIRMKHDGPQPRDSYTFNRLVNQVRNKIRKFITDHASMQTTNPHWAVGTTPGRITADDLTLLAIVSVSQGTVMPILKLRDNFVFSNA